MKAEASTAPAGPGGSDEPFWVRGDSRPVLTERTPLSGKVRFIQGTCGVWVSTALAPELTRVDARYIGEDEEEQPDEQGSRERLSRATDAEGKQEIRGPRRRPRRGCLLSLFLTINVLTVVSALSVVVAEVLTMVYHDLTREWPSPCRVFTRR
jgi:hypothetical protein